MNLFVFLLISQIFTTDTIRGTDFIVSGECFQTVEVDSVYRIDEGNGEMVFTKKSGNKAVFVKGNLIGWFQKGER